jgi:hypothetical protein
MKKATEDAIGIYNTQKLAGLESELTTKERALQD